MYRIFPAPEVDVHQLVCFHNMVSFLILSTSENIFRGAAADTNICLKILHSNTAQKQHTRCLLLLPFWGKKKARSFPYAVYCRTEMVTPFISHVVRWRLTENKQNSPPAFKVAAAWGLGTFRLLRQRCVFVWVVCINLTDLDSDDRFGENDWH